MMKQNVSALGVLTAAALSASTVFAAGAKSFSAIEQLPKEGRVSISGTVDEVQDQDTFILRDARGDTIDVHMSSAGSVTQGDRVTVTGQVQSETLGMGREIAAATVSKSGGAGAQGGSMGTTGSGASGDTGGATGSGTSGSMGGTSGSGSGASGDTGATGSGAGSSGGASGSGY